MSVLQATPCVVNLGGTRVIARTPPCGVNMMMESRRERWCIIIIHPCEDSRSTFAPLRLPLYVCHAVGICTTALGNRVWRPAEMVQMSPLRYDMTNVEGPVEYKRIVDRRRSACRLFRSSLLFRFFFCS